MKLYNSGYGRQTLGLSEMPFEEFIGLLRASSSVKIENEVVNPSYFFDEFQFAVELEREHKITVVKSEKESRVGEAFFIYQYDSHSQTMTPKWLVEIPLGNRSTFVADLAVVGRVAELNYPEFNFEIFDRFNKTRILPQIGSFMFSGTPSIYNQSSMHIITYLGPSRLNIFHNQTYSSTTHVDMFTTGGSLNVNLGKIDVSVEYLKLRENNTPSQVNAKEPSNQDEIHKNSHLVIVGTGYFSERVDLGQKSGKELLVVKLHWPIKDDQDMFVVFNFDNTRMERSEYRSEGYKVILWDLVENQKVDVRVPYNTQYSHYKNEFRISNIDFTYTIKLGENKDQQLTINGTLSGPISVGVSYKKIY
ncbi:MAG: hypothetical protein QXF76_00355 [Candidatus Anstonellales archaeon]